MNTLHILYYDYNGVFSLSTELIEHSLIFTLVKGYDTIQWIQDV